MKKQSAVAVRIHFRNDPESLFHELLVSPHELSLLKALIGLSPLKVQMKPLVTEARKTNKNLEARNTHTPMKSLIEKNLVQKFSMLAPSLPINRHCCIRCTCTILRESKRLKKLLLKHNINGYVVHNSVLKTMHEHRFSFIRTLPLIHRKV